MGIVTEHIIDCDVLVAGGGPAGVPCALAAARNGARTLLCHDRPVLGGNASSEVRMHMVGADCSGGRGVELACETREGGIIEEIRLETSVRNPQRSASMLDLVLYEMCRAEPNLTLLLNTMVTSASVADALITEVVAERPSTEDRFRIRAKVFVDCTGDGRLGAEAGAPFRMGREGRDDFGEEFAPELADAKTLGSSLLFQARKADGPVPFTAPPWARTFTEEDLRFRSHASSGIDRGLEYGYWWCEWGGHLDTIKDNEVIRDELMAIMLGVWDHIKNGGDHGADCWALDWFGFLPGKRESRRFEGLHMLTEPDLMESRSFDDAIGHGGWPIDVHPPEGVDAPDEKPCTQHAVPFIYDIPLRTCISRTLPNLMFAGRNASASHVAFASTRVMATCAVMGQGAGTAAALAVETGRMPRDIAEDPALLSRLRQRLLKQDVYLIGQPNTDPDDLARFAGVSASSAQHGGAVANILSGFTRATHGQGGAPLGRAVPGTHRWMSDPARGFPAWIELRWEQPVTPGEIHLIFDTGLHRPLTLTHSDAFTAAMAWGRPQPETVRDYAIEAECNGEWRVLAEVTGNYQRHRVHTLDPMPPAGAVRVVVHTTNGIDHARVCEVRVYTAQGAQRKT